MSRDEGTSGGVEWLDGGGHDREGSADTPPPRSQRWPRWTLPVVIVAIVAIVAGVLISRRDSGHPAAAGSTPAPTPTASSHPVTPVIPEFTAAAPVPTIPATPNIPSFPTPPRAPTVHEIGHPVLGITGDYELFARGPDTLVRVELGKGRVTSTGVPAVQSGGPLSFLVGPHTVIVRPWDNVPGYLVRDGARAQRLEGALAGGHVVFPGPEAGQLWVGGSQASRGTRRALRSDIDVSGGLGVIAPDGSMVAAAGQGNEGDTLHVIDLNSGADRATSVQWDQGIGPGAQVAWSPDSRWVFAAADQLLAVEAKTGRVHRLDIVPGNPGLTQVAIRSGTMGP